MTAARAEAQLLAVAGDDRLGASGVIAEPDAGAHKRPAVGVGEPGDQVDPGELTWSFAVRRSCASA